MDKNDEDILESALEDFEENEEVKEEVKEKSLREVVEEAGEDALPDFLQGDFFKNLPEEFTNGIPSDFNFGELETMMNQIAGEIQGNPAMQAELENIGSQFMKENVVQESMEEIQGKLRTFINEKGEQLPSEDLQRYEKQLEIYSRIVDEFRANNDAQAMELVANLSQYGDLPHEVMPPINEECRLF